MELRKDGDPLKKPLSVINLWYKISTTYSKDEGKESRDLLPVTPT
jgi:hypothetical protein